MAKTFTTNLSVEGVEALKSQLLQYKNSLSVKCEKLVSRLLQCGLDVATAKISESPLGKHITVSTSIDAKTMGCDGILLAKGDVNQQEGYEPFSILLAIEFGAGIHYNRGTVNPLINSNFPFGVGTFPGQTHAFEDTWYYWDDKREQWVATHGIKATMPMYNAGEEITNKILSIAREIF